MPRTLRLRSQVVILAVAAAGAAFAYPYLRPGHRQEPIVAFADVPVRQAGKAFTLSPSQLATVSSEAVVKRQFFEEIATEGKIWVDAEALAENTYGIMWLK